MARGSVDRIVSDYTGRVSYRARWEFIDDRGQRRHRSQSFPTRKQADDKLASVQHQLRADTYIEASDELLSALVDRWLATMRHRWRPSSYERMARCWAKMGKDDLGHLQLAKVRTSRLQAVYDALLGRGYSASAVLLLHTVLSGAFDAAVREGLLASNPAKGATLPKRMRKIPVHWDRDQANTFLAAIKPREDAALWTVFLYTGMRIGELIALQWQDVDLGQGTIKIRRTASRNQDGKRVILEGAKTKSSNRLVVLTKPCLAALKWHRQITTGNVWVFAGPSGEPLSDPAIRSRLEALIKETVLPRLTPHGFRYTAASLALAAGIHPKIVQEMLGHQSIVITMDIYTRVSESLKRSAADQFAEYLDDETQQHVSAK